jgi:hypothetical protein
MTTRNNSFTDVARNRNVIRNPIQDLDLYIQENYALFDVVNIMLFVNVCNARFLSFYCEPILYDIQFAFNAIISKIDITNIL